MSTSLHPIEQKVLAALRGKSGLYLDELVAATGLQVDQVRRSLEWLSTKNLVRQESEVGDRCVWTGRQPPESVLVARLESKASPMTIQELKKDFGSEDEFSAAVGNARRLRWIELSGGVVRLSNPRGRQGLQDLLQSLSAPGKGWDALAADERVMIDELRLVSRGLLRMEHTKFVRVHLTDEGTRNAEELIAAAQTEASTGIDRLTPEMLARGTWRGSKLRPIDVEAKAPQFYPGRRHPVRDFIREVKETYVSMGFTELEGGSVHPAFWNFDALFIPQDHPGRDMQDTFYLEGLSDKSLDRTGVVARVASTHEDGWRTGSRGWGYSWSIEEARRLVLRTHNTVLTVRALSESRERETRVFAVSKVYRNENLDYKHLAEFYQMDGIIVGEGLNVRHLMGFLKEFYKKLGMKDVKLWPTYFPYTEPSLEVVGYSEAAKAWIELSGSGLFRPEVTLPLGVRVPVLAWGPGIERLMLMRFGLDDMRELYGTDLSWLRRRVEYASRSH